MSIAPSVTRTKVDWQQETRIYDRPHPRLRRMAALVNALPQRRLLDVGCSTAALRTLLSDDIAYFGCDIADHAAAMLPRGHFQQLDFNRGGDLMVFASQAIDAVHIGGVLEYLEDPRDLLRQARQLVGSQGALIVSLINFQAQRYCEAESHHAGWIYKPTLDQFRTALAETGWQIRREEAFLGRGIVRDRLLAIGARMVGLDAPWLRRHARQFILAADAV
jgi:SAM-dependent methyltransferase